MPARVEDESEILLGNKQLLAVFAVVAILLATAFAGGYMLGKSSAEKKYGNASESSPNPSSSAEASGGPITQRVTPDDPQSPKQETAALPPESKAVPEPLPPPKTEKKPVAMADENVLGQSHLPGAPKHGQSFVQVMAVSLKDAQATADVLRKHDFQARVAPAPGNPGVYRVLVGPGKDLAELRGAEDALRKIGYTKCFVQHY